MRYTDIIGLEFGRYKIVEDLGMINGKRFVNCLQLDSGNIHKVNFYDMKNGKTNGYGKGGNHPITHGMSKTEIYSKWKALNKRCNNINDKGYENYGGRGIRCEWNSFEEFYNDMGDTHFTKSSIDRIDVNGNYCKENCRWATAEEQANNKTTTRYLEYDGKRMNISQWAKHIGIKRSTLSARINLYHWDIEKALTT